MGIEDYNPCPYAIEGTNGNHYLCDSNNDCSEKTTSLVQVGSIPMMRTTCNNQGQIPFEYREPGFISDLAAKFDKLKSKRPAKLTPNLAQEIQDEILANAFS